MQPQDNNRDKNWFQLALQVRGSVIPEILPRVILCSFFGFGVSALHSRGVPIPTRIFDNFILPNLVLGLLLVFRTNTAYDRFWEGRKLWGSLVNTVRNLARQIWVTIHESNPQETQKKIATLRLLVAFAFAMKLHLRGEKIDIELVPLVSPEQYDELQSINNPPLRIALWIGDYLQNQYRHHDFNIYQLTAMFKLLDVMVDALGGCERIIKTPIPLAYNIHLKQTILIFCLGLPFQIVDDLAGWTGIVVGFISFPLFGIEEIGQELENPFGYDKNDLQLETICATMLRNIEDLISIPPSVQSYSEYYNSNPKFPHSAG
ncbi:MAG: bestrophin family protein [Microcoleaceae cyanobacterium]